MTETVESRVLLEGTKSDVNVEVKAKSGEMV